MARNRSRTRSERVPSDLRGRDSPPLDSLADEVLDDPARLFESGFDPDVRPVDDLIYTGLTDSRRPFRAHFPVRSSPWLVSRASLRSETRPRVLEPKALYERALVCAKRTIRKEVLFALRKTGKGSGAGRRVRSVESKRRC